MWQIKTTPTKDLPQSSWGNSESDDDTTHNRSCSSVRTKMIEDATEASRGKRSRKSNGSVVQVKFFAEVLTIIPSIGEKNNHTTI